jgi:hypothetical protein
MSLFPPVGETWMVTLECREAPPGSRFLDGRVQDGSVGLAPNTDSPFTGTWWAVTTVSPDIVKFRCMTQVPGPRFLDGRPPPAYRPLRSGRPSRRTKSAWDSPHVARRARCAVLPGRPR